MKENPNQDLIDALERNLAKFATDVNKNMEIGLGLMVQNIVQVTYLRSIQQTMQSFASFKILVVLLILNYLTS